MSEPKWTPGPWGVTTRLGSWDWVVYSEADTNIEICQPFHDGTDLNERGEANAHLIKASPKLYEALARLLGATNPGNAESHQAGCRCVIHEARAALAEARGEGGK